MDSALHRNYLQPVFFSMGERGILSPREHEAVVCTAEGLTSVGVAMAMGISTRTANAHIESAIIKLGALNRVNMIAIACVRGMVLGKGVALVEALLLNLLIGISLAMCVTVFDGAATAARAGRARPQLTLRVRTGGRD